MRKLLLGCALSLAALALASGASAEERNAEESKKETKEQVKNPAKDFTLPDYNGNKHSLKDYRGKWVVLEWINHGCPFVKKHYNIDNMQALQRKYKEKGVVWISICSSAPGKQGYYTAEQWKKVDKAKNGAAHAVLLDPDGKVGKLYGAKTTPEMFVISPKGGVVYHGAIDSKKRAMVKDEIQQADNYVDQVLTAVLAGKEPPVTVTKSYGCSVKYP